MNEPRHKIMHKILKEFKNGTLGDDWTILKTRHGTFIAHIDFLYIQDLFNELENVDNIWSSKDCLTAIEQYFVAFNKSRQRATEFFFKSLDRMSQKDKEQVENILSKISNKSLLNKNEMLVGIPWIDDAPKLWEDFLSIDNESSKSFKPWAKIVETNVIFASKIHRYDNPEGHDYFAWAYRKNPNNILKSFIETARHEGSHCLTDEIIRNLLQVGYANPISEGLASFLGNDGRATKFCNISLEDFLKFEWINNKDLVYTGSYLASSKFFRSAFEVLINSHSQSNEALTTQKVVTAIIQACCDSAVNLPHTTCKKYVSFFHKFIEYNKIQLEKLSVVYEKLNRAAE